MRRVVPIVLCLALAGCGGSAATTTTAARTHRAQPAATAPPAVRVAVVGNVPIAGAGIARSSIDDADLVVVGPREAHVARLVAAHPSAHFVLVGRSFRRAGGANVTGLLFREDQAAYLAGVVAALVTKEEGARDATLAWVGTRRQLVADAFASGVRSVDRALKVVNSWTEPAAAKCKEAALDAIAQGATVVFAGKGACADGAIAGARDRNALGLRLADFVLPEVAVAQTVHDARAGLYHSGENVIFGARTGAVGVGELGSRVSAGAVLEAREVAQELATGVRSPG